MEIPQTLRQKRSDLAGSSITPTLPRLILIKWLAAKIVLSFNKAK